MIKGASVPSRASRQWPTALADAYLRHRDRFGGGKLGSNRPSWAGTLAVTCDEDSMQLDQLFHVTICRLAA